MKTLKTLTLIALSVILIQCKKETSTPITPNDVYNCVAILSNSNQIYTKNITILNTDLITVNIEGLNSSKQPLPYKGSIPTGSTSTNIDLSYTYDGGGIRVTNNTSLSNTVSIDLQIIISH